jgi:hypothetical protein
LEYCTKCILPENYPGISFNEEGICNYCIRYTPQGNVLGKDKLIQVINAKKKTGKYDCIVPMSGGKDSTYILFYTVKELDLNPLVVNYNSGYQDSIAEENVVNACERLGVDLQVVHSPGDIQRRLLKANYQAYMPYSPFWDACISCEGILRVVSKNIAQKHRVPFVMWGSTDIEGFGANKVAAETTKRTTVDSQYHSLIKKVIDVLFKKPLKVLRHIPFYYYNIRQRIALRFPLKYALRPGSTPPMSRENPEFIHFYDYVQWDSLSNVNLLEQELGWKHPDGKDIRFDCRLHCVGNYNRLHKYGITSDGINLCNFIREGRMSREEAIQREHEMAAAVDREVQTLLKEIL